MGEEKAIPLRKSVNEMVHDLQYAQGILQANIDTAKELKSILYDYLERAHLTQYVKTISELDIEKIDSMTLKDIDELLPGQELMPWDAPEVKGIQGSYGYSEKETQGFLRNVKERIDEYDTIVKTIDQARGYVEKMANTLQEERVKQAHAVINNHAATPEQKENASRYLSDLDSLSTCADFLQYVRENKDKFFAANIQYLARRMEPWQEKNPRLKDILSNVDDYVREMDYSAEQGDFLKRGIMSYIVYGRKENKHQIILKGCTLSRLNNLFTRGGTLKEEEIAGIQQAVDQLLREEV